MTGHGFKLINQIILRSAVEMNFTLSHEVNVNYNHIGPLVYRAKVAESTLLYVHTHINA